jgi:hypothetical protein
MRVVVPWIAVFGLPWLSKEYVYVPRLGIPLNELTAPFGKYPTVE